MCTEMQIHFYACLNFQVILILFYFLSLLQGVCIHSFGTFTFSQSKLELGGNKAVMIQRPVFVLSEKMAQTHGISYQKHHQSGNEQL